jgi:hypothetical protein
VHRSELPVQDVSHLRKAYLFFGAIQTVLTVNAVRKFNVSLDDPASAGLAFAYGKHFYGLPDRYLDEFSKRTKQMFTGASTI